MEIRDLQAVSALRYEESKERADLSPGGASGQPRTGLGACGTTLWGQEQRVFRFFPRLSSAEASVELETGKQPWLLGKKNEESTVHVTVAKPGTSAKK